MPSNVPVQLNSLISDCWKKEKADRPTAAQVLEKLQKIQSGAEAFGTSYLAFTHSQNLRDIEK